MASTHQAATEHIPGVDHARYADAVLALQAPTSRGEEGWVRDMTVLRQLAAHLDGWGGLRAQVVTEGVAWPSVQLQGHDHAQTWQCVQDYWTGQVIDTDGEPIATIETTIGGDATASEVADGIKRIYRILRTEHSAS
jgi:hypothetical protein